MALLGLWVSNVHAGLPEVPPGQVPGPGLPQFSGLLELASHGVLLLAMVVGGAALKGDAWLGLAGATLAGAGIFLKLFS